MKTLFFLFLATACLLTNAFAQSVPASKWQEEKAVCDMFKKKNIKATFIALDASTGTFRGCESKRAAMRYIPAETFDIANTLIAFETKTITKTDQALPYDENLYGTGARKKDMTIKEAMAESNQPFFQQLTRKIGRQTMKKYLVETKYGNTDIRKKTDTFWLNGPLKISAYEQVLFLDNVINERPPFSRQASDMLYEIMPKKVQPKAKGEMIYKTGLSTASKTPTGWVVGWLYIGGKFHSFAFNMDVIGTQDGLSYAKQALVMIFAPEN